MPSEAAHIPADEVRDFLEQICPGQASEKGCKVCPKETAFAFPASTQTWDLQAITLGHFVSPASEDALITGFGCEPHSSGFGGAYLFTRNGSGWRKVRYGAGVDAADCHRLRGVDARDRLVCAASDMHQGLASIFLYLLDPGRDQGAGGPALDDSARKLFFVVEDTLRSCVTFEDGTVQSGEIDRVDFTLLPDEGRVRIVVSARLGKTLVPKQVFWKHCETVRPPEISISTELRRYEFVFDGRTIVPGLHNPPMEAISAIAPKTSYAVATPNSAH